MKKKKKKERKNSKRKRKRKRRKKEHAEEEKSQKKKEESRKKEKKNERVFREVVFAYCLVRWRGHVCVREIIKKNVKKYCFNKRLCIIDNLMWVFLQIDYVK